MKRCVYFNTRMSPSLYNKDYFYRPLFPNKSYLSDDEMLYLLKTTHRRDRYIWILKK